MPQAVIDQHQRQNFFQTLWLLLGMAAVLSAAGFLMLGMTGVLIAFALLAFGGLFSPRISTAMLLRHYKAQRILPEEAPDLTHIMDTLCKAAKIASRPLYYIPSAMPNAFAAGTGDESFVAVTDGLLRTLDRRELAGVLAHEVAHIVNQDIRVLGTADAITRTASMMSRIGIFLLLFSGIGPMLGVSSGRFLFGGLVLFVAPSILIMLQLAISRTREFDADLGAAELTGDPAGLASALQKLKPPQSQGFMERVLRPGTKRTQPAMLRTHPPTEERVHRLHALELIKQEGIRTENAARAEMASSRESDLEHVPVFAQTHPAVKKKPRYHLTNGLWY